MLAGKRVDDLSAADGRHRRIAPDDETVPRHHHSRSGEEKLCVGFLARLYLIPVRENQPRHHFRSAGMEADKGPVFYFFVVRMQVVEKHIQTLRRFESAGTGQNVSPLDRRFFNTLQVDGRSLARLRNVDALVVHLHTPDPGDRPAGQNGDFFAGADVSGDQRSGHDRSKTLHAEYPVDGQPE